MQLWNFVKRALNQNTNPNAVLQTRYLNASYTMECNHSFLKASVNAMKNNYNQVSTISFQPSVDIKSQSYREVMEHFFFVNKKKRRRGAFPLIPAFSLVDVI